MCYAIPGKIIKLNAKTAIVDYFGEQRNVLNDKTITTRVGDYVYAQGGMIIDKLPTKTAQAILSSWQERLQKLKQIDDQLTHAPHLLDSPAAPRAKITKPLQRLLTKIQQNKTLTKRELLQLLATAKPAELSALYQTANQLRQTYLQNSCCVHGIIEFSNFCHNNCFYCGIRAANQTLPRYRMSVNEIVAAADYAVNKLKFKALVLQSGEDLFYNTAKLVEIITKIKKRCGVLLFMSVGDRSRECYRQMYRAGARGVLLRFESSNPRLYARYHRGIKTNFTKRLDLIRYAYQLGYIIATGAIVGLPGQANRDILNDIFLAKSLHAEMFSFGPLIPDPKTPLAQTPKISADTILKVIAVSRVVEPNAKILVTTALETLEPRTGRRRGLLAGANSLMINVTPPKYKQQYAIYPGRPDHHKEISQNIRDTLRLLYEIGRAPTDISA